MKALVIDISKCNGCYNCQIACKDEHVGNDWSPYAKPQPMTGHFWMKVNDIVRGTIPKIKIAYMHDICQQCDNTPCINGCPNKAIYKRNDGIVIIDPGKCRGDRGCISACPYDVIYFNEHLNISQKCTFCAHLLDKGWKEPRCVEACPTGALKFGEEEELKELIKKAEVLKPEIKALPRVYYLGLPKRFIAGAVFNPLEDECIANALATLKDLRSGQNMTTVTDDFGDFWFEGLNVSEFSLDIKKGGYKTFQLKSVSTLKDVNLGDIELKKQLSEK